MGQVIQLIDSYTKENVNYEETAVWHDGTPMDDSKVDNLIYRKKAGKYYVDCEYAARKVINIKRFGNLSNDPSANTLIIQKAVTVANSLSRFYAKDAIKPSPLPNYAVGYGVDLYLPSGLYPINNRINFSNFTNITGNNSIIHQLDPTKDIFYSESPFENTFKGLILIGGHNQITAQNGATNVVGLEGVLTRIENCIFQSNTGFSVVIKRSGAGGGHQFFINNVKWFEGKQFLYASCDKGSVKDSWMETSSSTQDNNTPWIDNRTSLLLDNIVFVPGGDYTNTTNRYVDNHDSVDFNSCRFGGEGGGGLPFVYNYADALAATAHPYQSGGSVTIRNCPNTSSGNNSKIDAAFVVLKAGIPKNIIIENNYYSADPPYIRTNLFNKSGFSSFAEYFNRNVNGRRINITIKHNSKWFPSNIIINSSDLDILRPFLNYTLAEDTGNVEVGNRLSLLSLNTKSLETESLVSGIRPTKSSAGNVLIFDSVDKNGANGWGAGGIYLFSCRGNMHQNSSALYKNAFLGVIGVFTYYNGTSQVYRLVYKPILNEAMPPWDAGMTVVPVFWDGTAESATISTSALAKIRVKVSPTNGVSLIEVDAIMTKII